MREQQIKIENLSDLVNCSASDQKSHSQVCFVILVFSFFSSSSFNRCMKISLYPFEILFLIVERSVIKGIG